MNNDKIKSSEKIINASVIIRLLIDAISALLMAYSASKDVRLQLHNDGIFLLVPVFVAFSMDMIFTLLWKASAELNIFHFGCYVLFGGIFYAAYFSLIFADSQDAELLNIDALTNDSVGTVHIIIAWAVGLIPFIMYATGKDNLKKANRERIKQLSKSSGDEDE